MCVRRWVPLFPSDSAVQVLMITEAPEPRELDWCELDASLGQWTADLIKALLAIATFVLISWAILATLQNCPWCVAIAVGLLNMAVAPVMIRITNSERHFTHTVNFINHNFKYSCGFS